MSDTYCVHCGNNDVKQSETGNGGELFAAEDMNSSIEFYDDLELWECVDCGERFFK